MNDYFLGILIFFLTVNTVAFLVMLWDKHQSRKKGSERISEGMLFFLASAFGSVGIFAGMFAFRHKNQKWYFLIGMPLLFLQNCAFLYVVHQKLIEKI